MTDRESQPRTPWERLEKGVKQAARSTWPVFETGIPMRDGIELAADVYLPAKTRLPAPAIVVSTPYDKGNSRNFGQEARLFQRNGYAYVVHDVRGRGKSEGVWRPWVNDGRDGHDVVEWVAAQDFCTGDVGTSGISYMGWTQWATAAERPPHLKAMASLSAAGRWQQEIPFTNGCFQLFFAWWMTLVRRRIYESRRLRTTDWTAILRTLPVNALRDVVKTSGETWQDTVERDRLDAFWSSLRLDDRYAGIDVPCLHITGWYDLEDLLGAFHHYEQMIAKSPAAARQQLLVGPWSHIQTRWPHTSFGGRDHGPTAAVDIDQVQVRWFDHWLKGVENGVDGDPPVRIFEPGTNKWREHGRWPLADTEVVLYLNFDRSEGLLDGHLDDAGCATRSYIYDPVDPAPTQLNVQLYPFEDVPLDQTPVEARSDVITYTSKPLTKEVTVSGWPRLQLFASTDGDDTDWHVKLTDVHADGRSYKVSQGELRAAYRDSLVEPTPVVPEQIYAYNLELWPTHHTFLPGHRIRLSVTSSDFPWFARNLNRFEPIATARDPRVATNTVHHGPSAPSRLTLPTETKAGHP